MKSLTQFIAEAIVEDKINEELGMLIGEDTINEAFGSSLLQELAKRIKDTGDSKFETIFGARRMNDGKKIIGVKWAEIDDKDFEKFESGDKKFATTLKAAKKAKESFIVIATSDADSKAPIVVVRGINNLNKDYIFTWIFKPKPSEEDKFYMEPAVKKRANSTWSTHVLNVDEIIELCSKLCVWYLPITDKMLSEYDNTISKREADKDGMVNYDEKSLMDIARKQKARYNALVKEMKANKLIAEKDNLLEEIKALQAEAVEVFEKVIKSDNLLTMNVEIGSVMGGIAYAYENLHKYYINKRQGQIAKEKIGDGAEKMADGWARDYITKAKEVCNEYKGKLDEIKKAIAA